MENIFKENKLLDEKRRFENGKQFGCFTEKAFVFPKTICEFVNAVNTYKTRSE